MSGGVSVSDGLFLLQGLPLIHPQNPVPPINLESPIALDQWPTTKSRLNGSGSGYRANLATPNRSRIRAPRREILAHETRLQVIFELDLSLPKDGLKSHHSLQSPVKKLPPKIVESASIKNLKIITGTYELRRD